MAAPVASLVQSRLASLHMNARRSKSMGKWSLHETPLKGPLCVHPGTWRQSNSSEARLNWRDYYCNRFMQEVEGLNNDIS